MIRAEDEEVESHRSPDSDYYSDLLSRVDSAVGEDDIEEDRAILGSSKVRNIAGWFGGRRRADRTERRERLSHRGNDDDDDDDGDEETDEEAAAAEADMAAQRAAVDEVCLFPASLSEWLAQPMVKVLLVAVLSGLVCGIEAANAMFSVASVSAHFGLSHLEHSGLLTASILGGTCGGVLGGTAADLYGRRFVLVVQGMALLPTALVAASASSLGAVLCARAMAAAVAMCSSCAALAFTFELCPLHRRGAAPAAWACAATGSWVAVKIAARYSPPAAMAANGWRVVGGGPHLVLALAQLLSLCRVPESPKWLASRGQLKEAESAVRKLWGQAVVSSSTAETLRTELNCLTDPHSHTHTLGDSEVSGAGAEEGAMAHPHLPRKANKKTTKTQRSSSSSSSSSSRSDRRSGSGEEEVGWEPEWGAGNRPCEQCVGGAVSAKRSVQSWVTSLQQWRPVVTLLSSICTSSTSAGGLQVLYWGPNVLAPCLVSPGLAEVVLTLAPVAAVAGFSAFVADDRLVGRRPLVIIGAVLMTSGSLLLSLLLMVFVKLPWHGPTVGLRWVLGVPAVLGAACAAAGWQLLVISLLPLLVCEATPCHARARALATLTAISVIYAPIVLVGFDTAKDNAGALGPALLMYSCSAGSMLLFLVSVLLVETSGKPPEQILQETLNRAGYVMFHATFFLRGTRCEKRCGRRFDRTSYEKVGEFQGFGRTLDDDDDYNDDEDEEEEEGKEEGKLKTKSQKARRGAKQLRQHGDDEADEDFGTNTKGQEAVQGAVAGSVGGLLGGLGLRWLLKKSAGWGGGDGRSSAEGNGGRRRPGSSTAKGAGSHSNGNGDGGGSSTRREEVSAGDQGAPKTGWLARVGGGGGGGEGGRGMHKRLATNDGEDGDDDDTDDDVDDADDDVDYRLSYGGWEGNSQRPTSPTPPPPAAVAAAPLTPAAPATRNSVLARLEAMKNKNKNKNQPRPAVAAAAVPPPSDLSVSAATATTAAATPLPSSTPPPPSPSTTEGEAAVPVALPPPSSPSSSSSSSSPSSPSSTAAPPLSSSPRAPARKAESRDKNGVMVLAGNGGAAAAAASSLPLLDKSPQGIVSSAAGNDDSSESKRKGHEKNGGGVNKEGDGDHEVDKDGGGRQGSEPNRAAQAAAVEQVEVDEGASGSELKLKLATLQRRKQVAVAAEDYREAASLAEQIKSISADSDGGSNTGGSSSNHYLRSQPQQQQQQQQHSKEGHCEQDGDVGANCAAASYEMLPLAAVERVEAVGKAGRGNRSSRDSNQYATTSQASSTSKETAATATKAQRQQAAPGQEQQEERKAAAAAAVFSAMMDDF